MVLDDVTSRARDAVLTVTSVPRALTGLAVARIGVGIAQLSLYTTNYSERHFLYGPDAVYPRASVNTEGSFNFYLQAGPSVVAFELLFHAGILACLAMVAGFGGRLVLAAAWATSWSLWAANPMLIDGGDNLAMVVMPMLVVSMCMERLSLRSGAARVVRLRELGRGWLGILLSNAAAFGIMAQLCVVYFLSGMYKAQGRMWVDGTAVYYIMRTPEYFHPVLSPLVLDHDLAIVVSTYAAMILLIGFAFLVLSPRTRLPAVLAMMGFHLGIGLFMGLTSFALVMIACDCVFVSSHVDRGIAAVRRRVDRLRGRDPEPAEPAEPAATAEPIEDAPRDDRRPVRTGAGV